MNTKQKIIVVAGPTASGKSDFAVELALQHNGEIVSADSRQVYKKLDIGTGKITHHEMKGVPHYMLDVYEIEDREHVSVTTFRDQALCIIDDIIARGKTPILCGGTGQYIDAIIYTSIIPKVPPNKLLREKLSSLSNSELYAMILEKDPVRAQTIDKENVRRLIRALEIINALGYVPKENKSELRYDVDFYLLSPSKETLEKRVHTRLLKRFDAGMVEEVERLVKEGHSLHEISLCGIEYKWIAQYLENKISYNELVERLRIATWQYAKRQRTWNKKYEKDTRLNLINVEVKE